MRYKDIHSYSVENPTAFWLEKSRLIRWHKSPPTDSILTTDEDGFYRWFKGGELNTSYLCLDHHLEEGRGDQPALIYDSPVTGTERTYTYAELTNKVARLAGGLREMGVEKGDRVIIYMPMVPEAVMSMLAVARLGAIHSVVFGGFAPHELAVRIDDAKPKAIITATSGIEINRVIPYMPLVDKALELAEHKVEQVLVYRRDEDYVMREGRDRDFYDSLERGKPLAPVWVDATDPLYILYTSGTTGKPKGVLRDNGGHAVALKYSMKAIYNTNPGEVFWAASDVGWVVGHSYIVYGPLLQGCTTIVYEGKPVRTPDPGAFWRVIAQHKVATFFTAPTAFRAIRKEDPDAHLLKKYNMDHLRTVFLAGERLDPPTYEWLLHILDIPVVDHWWQTETGWPIVGNPMGLESFPTKMGSATRPMPGYDVQVLDDGGKRLGPGENGNIVVKLPLPPGCLPSLWDDSERFRSSYLEAFDGYYLTADGGFMDADDYVFIMGRIDDVINVAGHRLSTGEMEQIIGSHASVAECAVVGLDDALKGQIPVGFLVLKDGVEGDPEALKKAIVQLVRDEIGAVASLKSVLILPRLPKTRSGKILRKTIRQLALSETVPVPSTIDDPTILDEIRDALRTARLGQYASIA